MLNQVVLVGRLVDEIEKLSEKESILRLVVPRNDKNGEVDFINCRISGSLAKTAKEYCHKGCVVGIKARLISDLNGNVNVMVDKLTFLANESNEDKEEEKTEEGLTIVCE